MPLYMLPSFIYTYEVTTHSAIADFAEAAAEMRAWAKAGNYAAFGGTFGVTLLLSLWILCSNILYLLWACSSWRSSPQVILCYDFATHLSLLERRRVGVKDLEHPSFLYLVPCPNRSPFSFLCSNR